MIVKYGTPEYWNEIGMVEFCNKQVKGKQYKIAPPF